MQNELKNKGVVIVALTDEPMSKVAPFAKQNSMNYIIGTDAGSTRGAFGVKGYPTYFVIDPDGKVVWSGHSGTEAEKAVEKTLKEKPPKGSGSLFKNAADASLKKADKLYKKKDFAKAKKAYEKIVKDFKGTDAAKKAKAQLTKMKSDKTILADMRSAEAKKKCESLLGSARILAKAGKDDEATKYYKRIISEFPGTKYADTARREMEEL